PAGREEIVDAREGHTFPEVGQMVEGVARMDELWRLAAVLVREEARLDPLHGVASTARDVEHRRRDVDADDTSALRCRGRGEQARAAAQIDERRVRSEAVQAQEIERALDVERRL